MTHACRAFLIAVLALVVGGCAATVQKSGDTAPIKVPAESSRSVVLNIGGSNDATTSKDWERFKGVWRAALNEQLGRSGGTLSSQEGEAKATGDIGTLLVVYIDDFRYVSGGARFAFGIMTGNAFVRARVTFRDLKTDESFGERRYDTTSSAWQGIMSAMTDKQVGAICSDIASTLSVH